ncbi:MAG: hypothetical protein H0T73_11085 [Ardenticatenales bacterium]|nr:hypothetical protein [Ardenticatenales bacterium]
MMAQSAPGARPRLELFVTADCPSCQTARQVAAQVAAHFPMLVEVHVIDLDLPGTVIPSEVFASPTFRLNGRIISLGTPT